jgi:phenylacetic acid degradation operon negative regulatory protein
MRQRKPAQLLLAFFGDIVMDHLDDPIPAPLLLDVLEGGGVAPATTRATLNRMAHRGMLTRVRKGRGIGYGLTREGTEVLREAAFRVNRHSPFDAQGDGWTLVTFSVPEGQRTLRHRLRATLNWAGFAPLRDGLWVAPGRVDLGSALHPLQSELPHGSLTAFHAHALEGFEMDAGVTSAWDLEGIRAHHQSFTDEWRVMGEPDGPTPALTCRTALIADWLALLRTDPGLPREYLGHAWPADESTAVFRARRSELLDPSVQELEERAS